MLIISIFGSVFSPNVTFTLIQEISLVVSGIINEVGNPNKRDFHTDTSKKSQANTAKVRVISGVIRGE